LPVAIFAVSLFSIYFSHLSNFIGTLWPTNAIILVALLRHARNLRNYGSILLGGVAANALAGFAAGDGAPLVVVLAVANALEIVTALALLSLFHIHASNLTSFRNVLIFIAVAGGIAPLANMALSVFFFGVSHGMSFPWRNWYASHALGTIIGAPFLISVTSSEWRAERIKERLPEAAATVAAFIALSICASYFRSFLFIVAPAILYATVRFGLIGATMTTFFTAVLTSTLVVTGIGQPILSQAELSDRILALQLFLAITSLWALPGAALLIERDRLLGDLSRVNAQLAADSERKSHLVTGLRRHLAIAEERERLRLSHELHDQAGQSLIAAILELNEIDALTSGPAHQRLHPLRKKLVEMGKTLHRIAWELRPPSIDELGLRKALTSYIADWSEQCGIAVDFHCDDPRLDEVPDEIAIAVFRVVQEGLTNIVKHAQRPTDVSVVVRRADTSLQAIIEDNGCGFDVAALAAEPNAKAGAEPAAKSGSRRGLGLAGMRERLSLVGGTLEVESAVGAGTTIFARIALNDQRSPA